MAVKQNESQQPKLKAERFKVLVVCHGSICRSPLAGAVLRQRIPHQAQIEIAGLSDESAKGRPAAKKVREWAKEQGIDLSQHRSQRVTQLLIDWTDEILYFDGGNLKRLAGYNCLAKCYCLGSWIGKSRIADPAFLRKDSVEFSDVLRQVVYASEAYANEKTQAVTPGS